MAKIKRGEHEYFLDDFLVRKLDMVRNKCRNQNSDHVIIIDGHVGEGKSTLAVQIAAYLDENFTVNDLHFEPEQFMDAMVPGIFPQDRAVPPENATIEMGDQSIEDIPQC